MRFQLERFAFWMALIVARVLPRKLFLLMGTCFGMLAFHLDRRHRFIALQNFSTAFPDVPGVEARKTTPPFRSRAVLAERVDFSQRHRRNEVSCNSSRNPDRS